MDMLATLRRSGGINALARQLGEPPAAAKAGVQALLPLLLAGFVHYSGKLPEVLHIFSDLGGGGLAAQVMGFEPTSPAQGMALLGRVIGDSDAIRGAIDADSEGGADTAMLERMLPLLAMLIGGYVAARAAGGGMRIGELEAIFDAAETGNPADEDSAPL